MTSLLRSPDRNAKSNDKSAEDILLSAVVDQISFRHEASGFAVVQAQMHPESRSTSSPAGEYDIISVVGIFPPLLCEGSYFIARGNWENSAKFGLQFRAKTITESRPTTPKAIARYLGSGFLKGIGPALAQRIVEKFGERTLEILDASPERLREIPGIGDSKLSEIVSQWETASVFRQSMLFFHNHDITPAMAQKIYQRYESRTVEVVSNAPYRLAREIDGVGFLTADRIAQKLGFALDAPERLRAGVSHVILQARDDGHCYLPESEALELSARLLGCQSAELIADSVEAAVSNGEVIRERGHLYTPSLFQAEQRVIDCLREMLAHSKPSSHSLSDQIVQKFTSRDQPNFKFADLNTAVPSVFELSPQQVEAVRLAAKSRLLIITGGPGCGKTTVVRTILSMLKYAGLEVSLAAPTGRAAQRMSEVCSFSASTIHRLLKYDPMSNTFSLNASTQLPIDALIVDECSMVDLPLAASLFSAIGERTRVILVGDADQLPSVGPGRVLADLLAIEEIPRVKLSKVFRQSSSSSIIQVAHSVNSKNIPRIPQPDGATKSDTYFLPISDSHRLCSLLTDLVARQIPEKFGYTPEDITVLSPMNQGTLGIIALNKLLQEALCPLKEGEPHVRVGENELRLGDRVVQRVNNYSITPSGVFNGDQGKVVGIDSGAQTLVVKFWDGREVTYQKKDLPQLDLGYALTIHRAQGSESPIVVLVLHPAHTIMLERQLLYTAITRAKKLLILMGTQKALETAVHRDRSRNRYTSLVERWNGIADGKKLSPKSEARG